MRIHVTHVSRGKAPDTSDRVRVDADRGGFYFWMGVVHVEGREVYGGSPPEFRTPDEAETNAVSWAMAHGATELLIEADSV